MLINQILVGLQQENMMKMRLRAIQTMTNDSKRPRRRQWLNINGGTRETSGALLLVILGLTVNLIALVDFENTPSNGNETKIFVPSTTMHHRSTQPDSGVLPVETMDIGEPSANQSRCSDSKTDRISTHFSSQTSNSKLKTPKPVVNKVSLKDMKDEYNYNFNKNIDVDEQFLIENEQHIVDGVDLCKHLSEYEQGETEVLVKGRLKESVSFREKIGGGSKVLEIISQGCNIPLFEIPQPSSFKNNKSALDNSEFVSSSIQELIRTKRVAEVSFIPQSIALNIFSVCLHNNIVAFPSLDTQRHE